MRNGILLSAALLTAALSGSDVFAQTPRAGTGSSSTRGLKASSTIAAPIGSGFVNPVTGANGNGTLAFPSVQAQSINGFNIVPGLRSFRFPATAVTPFNPLLQVVPNPVLTQGAGVPNQSVNPVIIGADGLPMRGFFNNGSNGARLMQTGRAPIQNGGFGIQAQGGVGNTFIAPNNFGRNTTTGLGTNTGAAFVNPQGQVVTPQGQVISQGQVITPQGQVVTGQAVTGQQVTGFDANGNPIVTNGIANGVNNGFTGFDALGNPTFNGLPANALVDQTGAFANTFFPGFNPGFSVMPWGTGMFPTLVPDRPFNQIPAPVMPMTAGALPTPGINMPGAMRNPARPFTNAANRARTQRVRFVDGTVGSGRVIDGGDGVNLNYRTVMAQQSETAPAIADTSTRLARSNREINERVARADSDEVFITGPGGTRRMRDTGGTTLTRNSGIVERVAGSREEISDSSSSVMEVQEAPANAEQIRLVKRAENIMENRPLVQGRVARTGATGIEVTYEVNGVYRTEVFPTGQVFFFRDNGEMAAADTDPSRVALGGQVLVPLPGSEPQSAVAGSRQESRTTNTYIFNGANGKSGMNRSTTVRSKVAGSRQTTRARARRPAR